MSLAIALFRLASVIHLHAASLAGVTLPDRADREHKAGAQWPGITKQAQGEGLRRGALPSASARGSP